MNYEEFEARAKSVFDDCSEKKRMLWNMQSVVGTVLDMVRKNERLDRERAELRQENAALKAELDDLKGNAEGFEPDACMRLPLDADGVPIRLKDWVWYVGIDAEIIKDDPQQVVGLVSEFGMNGIYAVTRDYPDKAISPKMLTHRGPEPPDSWEKLEEDASVGAQNYCAKTLTSDDDEAFAKDIIRRAKKLAGIEEQEGE